jgi:hypothetical protein
MLPVCILLYILNQFTDFHETWCEHYTIGLQLQVSF